MSQEFTSTPNGAVEPFLVQEKVQDLLTTIEETGSKVGRHRIPLGGITTALWWTLGRESPAYLSDLQGHFLSGFTGLSISLFSFCPMAAHFFSLFCSCSHSLGGGVSLWSL
jgi:hypothetical protein